MIGKRFGSLIVESSEMTDLGLVIYNCSCDCGGSIKLTKNALTKTKMVNCGCISLRIKRVRNLYSKSKFTKDPLYKIWSYMKGRCYNKNHENYMYYGGRGIRVCREWRTNFEAFRIFCKSNGWEKGLEIDRIDNNGDYTPENCRFVTHQENSTNKSDSYRWCVYGVEYKTAREAAEASNISQQTLMKRCKANAPGYSVKKLYEDY